MRDDTLSVQSRAACGLADYSTGCVFVLDEDDRASLVAQGNIEFNSSCEVIINSTHDRAFTVNGNACLNADYIGTSGGYVNNGNANVGCMGDQEVAVDLAPPAYYDGASGTTGDPLLQYLPPVPTVATDLSDVVGTNINISSDTTLSPGRYYGTTEEDPLNPGTYITNEALRITGGTVYFKAGLYIIDSGMRITGGTIRVIDPLTSEVFENVDQSDLGITFYFTESPYDTHLENGVLVEDSNWGRLTIAGGANVKFYAPAATGDDYAGWLFWEDALAPDRSPGHRIEGTSDSELVGIIYFPTRDLFWGGTSATSDWVMIVVDNLTIAGGAIIPTAGLNDSSIPNPIQTVTLLE